MFAKKSSTTADILSCLSDGKYHTLNEIAEQINVSKITVHRHIQSLAYCYPIETFRGGINRGGVKLDSKYIFQGKILTNEKLQILGKALALLQEADDKMVDQKILKELLVDFTPPTRKECKEDDKIL